MKIMKLLTNSILKSVIESNGAFPCQMSARGSASHPAAPFVRMPGDGGYAAAQRECSKDRSGIAPLGLAILVVIGAGTLWGWAITQLGGLFLQAEALLLRNTFPFS
jgi:hypothetical protein